MFLLGFLFGVACATCFILYGDGDLLIRLGGQIRQVGRRYREWEESDRP